MKRYLLFAGDVYYPNGGMFDLKYQSDSNILCQEYLKRLIKESERQFSWAHIYDTVEQKVVWKFRGSGIFYEE